MTSRLATNAKLGTPTSRLHFLQATKEGHPIEGQVPRTYQSIPNTGGTINYDGSNEILITGITMTAPVVIRFGPLTNIRNWLGRTVNINISTPNAQTITLDTSPVFMVINGTALQQFTHVIPTTNTSKTITVYIGSLDYINVDYGAAVASIVPASMTFTNVGIGEGVYANTVGTQVNLRTIDDGDRYTRLFTSGNTINVGTKLVVIVGAVERYFYGNSYFGQAGSAVQLFNPVGDTLNIQTPHPNGISQAGLFTITTPVISGFTPVYDFVWTPPARMNMPYTVSVNFYRGPDVLGGQQLLLIPEMENVLEHEYVMCSSNVSTGLFMYDPDSDPGTETFAKYPITFGYTVVTLAREPYCICTDLQDNLIFYVPDAERTRLRVASTSSNQFYGQFSDIDLFQTGTISGGGNDISDVCYNEVTSTVYVLPTKVNGRIMAFTVYPKLNDASNFPIVSIGPITTIPFDGSFPSNDLFSICLLNNDGDFLISYDDGSTKIGAFRIDANTNTIKHLYSYDTGTFGRVSLMMGSRGRVIAQYSSDERFYVSQPSLSILEGLVPTYRPARFYSSLTVNCFNYISQP